MPSDLVLIQIENYNEFKKLLAALSYLFNIYIAGTIM